MTTINWLASIESSFSLCLQRRWIFISLYLGRAQARWRGGTVLWFNSLSIFSLLSSFVFSYTPLSLYHLSTYIIILIDCGILLSFSVFLLSFFIFAFVIINFNLPLSWSFCTCRFDPFLAIAIAISDCLGS